MNNRTIFGFVATVFILAGAALALNLFTLAAPGRQAQGYGGQGYSVQGYGARGHAPSYIHGRQCQDDPVACALVVW